MMLKSIVSSGTLTVIGRRLGNQRGAAAVEFALLLTILVVLVLGMFDFGRVFDAWLVATNAAREGARYGSICAANPDPPCAPNLAQTKATSYFLSYRGSRTDLSSPRVTVVSGGLRQPVVVTVSVDVYLGAYISDILRRPFITVTGTATMRV